MKLTLFGLIVASLGMMWSNRNYVADAYDTSQETQEVRLSGVDLAVTQSTIEPSPFVIPAAPDTRRALLPVLGREEEGAEELPPPPEPEIVMTGGKTRLSGTVVGPDGPVGGAIVDIQRHTTEGIGSVRAVTSPTGGWVVGGLPGGRYRVRAWFPGLMTTGGSEVRYIAEEEQAEFAFSMWGVDPTPELQFIHGGRIYDGLSGQVAVVMSHRFIDDEGILVTAPISGGLITIQTTSGMTIASSPTQLTDLQGVARFRLTCPEGASSAPPRETADGTVVAPGQGTLTARSGEVVATFALPGCRPIPVPEPPPTEPGPDGRDSDGPTSSGSPQTPDAAAVGTDADG